MGLMEILSIPQVDIKKTKTNHILEIQKVLGIEAARTSIIDQIKYTIGIYAIKVDIRHINILADAMTNKGRINGITRYGIAKMRDSTLMLASFEKTGDILFDASYFGKTDRILGVSEKIIIVSSVGNEGRTDEFRDWVLRGILRHWEEGQREHCAR